MFRPGLILFILYAFIQTCSAQDRPFAQSSIDTLCSPYFYGRGYVNDGDVKAARYIAGQFQTMGLLPLGSEGYFYPFRFFVNTFPGKCSVKAGGKKLVPGVDFIVDPGCPPVRGRFSVRNSADTTNKILRSKRYGWLFDTTYKPAKKRMDPVRKKDLRIDLSKHLTWSVSTRTNLYPGIEVLHSAWPVSARHVRINIRSQMQDHAAFNVIGYVPGREITDSFLLSLLITITWE